MASELLVRVRAPMPAFSNLLAVLGEVGAIVVLGPKAKREGRSGWMSGRLRFSERYSLACPDALRGASLHLSVFVLEDRDGGGWRVRNGAGTPIGAWLCAAALGALAQGDVVDPARRLRVRGGVATILELAHASGALEYVETALRSSDEVASEADADSLERAVLEDARLRRTAREIDAPRRARTISEESEAQGGIADDVRVLRRYGRVEAALLLARERCRALVRDGSTEAIVDAAVEVADLLRESGRGHEIDSVVRSLRPRLTASALRGLIERVGGEGPTPPDVITAEPVERPRYRHARFGIGELIEKTASGLRLRFADGTERVLRSDRLESV